MAVKITECPRDAIQGINNFIPTVQKAKYINDLLNVGFDTIDFGSFVSADVVPQMRDSEGLYHMLEWENSSTNLLAIIANTRGAKQASGLRGIKFLGFPFSISETFQLRNTNSTIKQSLERVKDIHDICAIGDKEMVIYISMAFGNPYGDEYNSSIVSDWIYRLNEIGIKTFLLADTVGVSDPENISALFKEMRGNFPELEIGAHLHSNPAEVDEKIKAAYDAGCRKFDSAIGGMGGCPMATDKLTGNISTERLVAFLQEKGEKLSLNRDIFNKVVNEAVLVYSAT